MFFFSEFTKIDVYIMNRYFRNTHGIIFILLRDQHTLKPLRLELRYDSGSDGFLALVAEEFFFENRKHHFLIHSTLTSLNKSQRAWLQNRSYINTLNLCNTHQKEKTFLFQNKWSFASRRFKTTMLSKTLSLGNE